MNKTDYLNQLETNLRHYRFSDNEINDILNDYTELYEDALSSGLSDEEVYNKLGSPLEVVKELKGNPVADMFIPNRKRGSGVTAILSITPMLCVVAFLLLGLLADLWYPGWLVFLLIPVVNILISSRLKFPRILAPLSPFISLTAFILLGYFGYWHPGWMVWFLIPLCGMISGAFSRNN